jgi:cytochrome c-type biogenesis protein CcmF
VGYCTLVVPFAYSIAALLRGSFTPDWLVTTRRWALFAWAVLSVGIFLGGKWAYVELGWAGYWAWDPVENSSFMPWLAITAALHTMLILDKTGRLPRLTTFLSMLGFILTFLGTFITRSGVISSVHSFAESNIGPAYLAYIVVLMVFALGLVFSRGSLLQGAGRTNAWVLSKESTLLFTDFFLLFLLALVGVGTLLPLIVEAVRGVKISIQQPFFNAFAPWIGVGLVAILGVGNLMRWRNGKIDDPVASLAFPAVWATLLTALLAWRKELDVRSTIGFFLVIWTAGTLVMDLVFKLKAIRWNGKAFLKFNRPYLGAWIAHMGFLVAIAGFLGAYRGIEQQTTLDLGQSTEFFGYTLTNRGLEFGQAYNYQNVKARIEAVNRDGDATTILPMRSKYTNKEEWLNEIGVHSTFWHDVYLVLASFDTRTQQVALKMHINPTVKFVWTSLIIMVLGALVGLSHRVRKRSLEVDSSGLALETVTEGMESLLDEVLERDPGKGRSKETRGGARAEGLATSIALIGFAVGIAVFGFSGVAWAQPTPGSAVATAAANEAGSNASSPSSAAPVVQVNPRLRAIGEELRCPTCQGISILESETPQSVAMRAEIEKQLVAGKSREEILDFFKERYGDWILRKPDARSGLGFWVWAIPVAGLIVGPVLLIFALRRSRQRSARERAELVGELRAFIEAQKNTSQGGA